MPQRAVLLVGFERADALRHCAHATVLAVVDNRWHVDNEERGRPIVWCRLRAPLGQIWQSEFATARLLGRPSGTARVPLGRYCASASSAVPAPASAMPTYWCGRSRSRSSTIPTTALSVENCPATTAATLTGPREAAQE